MRNVNLAILNLVCLKNYFQKVSEEEGHKKEKLKRAQ